MVGEVYIPFLFYRETLYRNTLSGRLWPKKSYLVSTFHKPVVIEKHFLIARTRLATHLENKDLVILSITNLKTITQLTHKKDNLIIKIQ